MINISPSSRYPIKIYSNNKREAAKEFRKKIIKEYVRWYNGEIKILYGEPMPVEEEKVKVGTLLENVIMTWGKIHQEKKYLSVLNLNIDAFEGMKILDLGSGPYPSAAVFQNSVIYCLDPLIPYFKRIGYPFHLYDSNIKFYEGYGEKMPFSDDFFDAVISVNAIDHFDSLVSTSREIKRVLHKDGLLRLHLHYHKPTVLEPIKLNDNIIREAFSWCNDFNNIKIEKQNYKFKNEDGYFSLWTNFSHSEIMDTKRTFHTKET